MIPLATSNMTSPDPAQFAVWMACAFLAVKMWNEFQVARGKGAFPNPVTMKGEIRYATHEELQQLRGDLVRMSETWTRELGELEQKIDNNYAQAMKAGEARATKIHERVNSISESVGEVRGELKNLVVLITNQKR